MYYSFMGEKLLGFMSGGFYCRTTMGLLPSLSYILSGGTPLSFGSFTCPLVPLPAATPKKTWLRRSPAEIFSPPPPPRRSVVGVPSGSSTSAAPLERGIGGRRQAARVTECRSTAELWRSSSSRS